MVSCIKSKDDFKFTSFLVKPKFKIHCASCHSLGFCFSAVNCVAMKQSSVRDAHLHFFFQSKWVCMCEWQPGISLLSATYVSVNRPAELQRGVKFCPIPDLWPRGAFFLTERNLIFPLHLWYIHLPRPARCPTKSGPCMSSSTCTDLHLCMRARKAFLTFLRHRTLEKFSRPSRLDETFTC